MLYRVSGIAREIPPSVDDYGVLLLGCRDAIRRAADAGVPQCFTLSVDPEGHSVASVFLVGAEGLVLRRAIEADNMLDALVALFKSFHAAAGEWIDIPLALP